MIKVERCGKYGIVLETESAVYILDFSEGTLPSHYLMNSKPKLFLVSRRDTMHYSESITSYHFPILASYDFKGIEGEGVHIMNAGDFMHLGYAKVRAFTSTRRGLVYVIEEGTIRILLGGDLNLWHWPDRFSDDQIQEAILRYYGVLYQLRSLGPYDLALTAIDPVMQVDTDRASRELITALKPKVFIPTGYRKSLEIETFVLWSKSQNETRVISSDINEILYLEGID